MITFFQSSVASAFIKALQFFCMANAPANAVPFEKLDSHGTDIERYIEDLLNGYNAHGGASKRMQDYRVIELRRCKERTEVGHEYVSAKVVGPDPISTFYIMFERFRGPDDPDTKRTIPVEISDERKFPRFDHGVKAIVQASSKAMQTSGDDLSKQSSLCLQDGRAHDRVSTFDEPIKKRKDEINRTVIFKDSIPLYKVAVLAHTVHCSEKTYALNSSSCYFYATAVMQAMEQAYKNEIDRRDDSNTAGTKSGMVPIFRKCLSLNHIAKPKLIRRLVRTSSICTRANCGHLRKKCVLLVSSKVKLTNIYSIRPGSDQGQTSKCCSCFGRDFDSRRMSTSAGARAHPC